MIYLIEKMAVGALGLWKQKKQHLINNVQRTTIVLNGGIGLPPHIYMVTGCAKYVEPLSLIGENGKKIKVVKINKSMYLKSVVSSANPEKLSLTIQGLGLTGLIVIIVYVLKYFGFDVNENDVTVVVETVLLIISNIMFLYGLVRKIILEIKKRIV